MCGICGIVGPPDPKATDRVGRMMARMRHRGPDGQGVWSSEDGRITFGHVRLAIVDTSDAGAQPMHHPAGLTEVVNGEIYNYHELRRRLEHDGAAPFRSHCDSEVILHGIAAEGISFLKALNGMFAVAVSDLRAGSVWLARDRLGIKPLYYLMHGEELIFASEIKALFAALDVDEWSVDLRGLSQFLAFQTPLGGATLFEGVRQLEPGRVLEIDPHVPLKAQLITYWSASALTPEPIGYAEARSQFGTVFGASVRRHLLSDVGVSSYLSAGFDSAMVSAVAARQMERDSLTAYTGYYDDASGWYDETGPAKELAQASGINHQPVEIRQQDLVENFDDLISALDAPQMGMGAFSQYMVARSASTAHKVILTGHGGDELFSGYPVFKGALGRRVGLPRISELPHLAYFAMSRHRGRNNPEFGRGLPVLWSMSEQKGLLGNEVDGLSPWKEFDELAALHPDPMQRIFHTYLTVYLPGLLIVEDKISMAHSLEARTPFLDNEMVAFSGRIPQSVKLHDGVLKALVRDAARSRLPASYFDQPKRGFPTPMRLWMRRPGCEDLVARIASGDGPLEALFAPDFVRRFVGRYRRSPLRSLRALDEIQSHKMWQLLALDSWLRIWSDRYGIGLRLS
ncbi:MAG: asparagine synthase (glutamine-hydrolyzing) [Silicimonas sp.]|uniref:asparagine synthase (glutamine-hydrolyzing) n=1 Tax=Roseitalea porphyridii TaxID=1852022 RepID=UPI0032ECB954